MPGKESTRSDTLLRRLARSNRVLPRKLRVTREGKFFVLITVAMGFAAINTGNNLLYLLLGMLLSLIMLSGVLSETAVRGAIAERLLDGRGFAGTPRHTLLRVENSSGRLSGYSLKIREHLEDEEVTQQPQPVFHLGPGARRDLTLRMTFPRRGRYHSYGLRVETGFPFALFEKTRLFELPKDLLVYPRLLDEVAVEEQIEQLLGDATESLRAGRGLDDYGVRDQRAGDPLNRVHWKLTAKKDRLVIREFDDPRGREFNLFLMNVAGSHESGEHAISFAATILEALGRSGALSAPDGQDLRLRFATLDCLDDGDDLLSDRERALEHLATIPLYPAETRGAELNARALDFLTAQDGAWHVIAPSEITLPSSPMSATGTSGWRRVNAPALPTRAASPGDTP
jgi:hypothetical protein